MSDNNREELVALIRSFVEREVQPQAGLLEERAEFPRDLFVQLGKLGAVELTTPEAYGGLGADTRTYVEVLEEIAAGSIGLAGTYMVHMSIINLLVAVGTDRQVSDHLPSLLRGSVGAMAMTETEAGSDLAAIRGTATETGQGFCLNASKMFITSGGQADLYVVLLRHGPGTSLFIVPNGTPGLSFGVPLRKMGYNSSPTTPVTFDNVKVPAGNLLGEPGRGLATILGVLDTGRLGVAAMGVGLARAALDVAYDYVTTREQFNRPLIDFQALEFMAADMQIAIEGARQLVRFTAERKDMGLDFSAEASMAKVLATDTAMRVTTDAVQLLGGYGYTREFPVERYMREAKMLQIVEGTNQIQRVVIAKNMRRRRCPAPVATRGTHPNQQDTK
jgi:alkylation response protein AidB-like acyl-CoA dehydrogenase